MKTKNLFPRLGVASREAWILPALLFVLTRASGEMVVGWGGGPVPQPKLDCIPQAQRDAIAAAIAANTAAPRRPPPPDNGPAPYPFQPIAGTVWQDRFINNFVDLDSSSGILDWDCTGFTYDGHRPSLTSSSDDRRRTRLGW